MATNSVCEQKTQSETLTDIRKWPSIRFFGDKAVGFCRLYALFNANLQSMNIHHRPCALEAVTVLKNLHSPCTVICMIMKNPVSTIYHPHRYGLSQKVPQTFAQRTITFSSLSEKVPGCRRSLCYCFGALCQRHIRLAAERQDTFLNSCHFLTDKVPRETTPFGVFAEQEGSEAG